MNPVAHAHVTVAAKTHPGVSGKNNEDRYGVSAYRLEDAHQTPAVLAIVADGIGGHRAGEVAAELAVEAISQVVAPSDARRPVETLSAAIVQAGQLIYDRSETEPALKGMGSTCAVAWIIGNRLYAAAVGDSRIYLLRNSHLRQLSTDHTWVQEAIDKGALRPEQAKGHPNAHVIRRYLGSRQDVVPDFRLRVRPGDNDLQAEANQGMYLQPGDILLLCSDGLTDLVEDREILSVLQSSALEPALHQMTELANQRGGHDNITLVGLQIPNGNRVAEITPERGLLARASLPCLAILALAAVGFLALLGIYWLAKGSPTGSGRATDANQGILPAKATAPLWPTPRPTLPESTAPVQQGDGGIDLGTGVAPLNLITPTLDLEPRVTHTPWPTNTPLSP